MPRPQSYFAEYGTVEDVILMYDRETKRPRGFGFVTFSAEEPVDALVAKRFVEINKKQVEIKAALPKSSMGEHGGSRRGQGGGSMGASFGQNCYGHKADAPTTRSETPEVNM